MFVNDKKKLKNSIDSKNWLITTDNFQEPKLVHKTKDIILSRDEMVKIAEYCQNIIAIMDCISNR